MAQAGQVNRGGRQTERQNIRINNTGNASCGTGGGTKGSGKGGATGSSKGGSNDRKANEEEPASAVGESACLASGEGSGHKPKKTDLRFLGSNI